MKEITPFVWIHEQEHVVLVLRDVDLPLSTTRLPREPITNTEYLYWRADEAWEDFVWRVESCLEEHGQLLSLYLNTNVNRIEAPTACAATVLDWDPRWQPTHIVHGTRERAYREYVMLQDGFLWDRKTWRTTDDAAVPWFRKGDVWCCRRTNRVVNVEPR